MNDDKELLELAAKAAGYTIEWDDASVWNPIIVSGDAESYWTPLTDDGDALRLAVKLNLDVGINCPNSTCIDVGKDNWVIEQHNNDPYAATRRAIVRAAAEIGRGME